MKNLFKNMCYFLDKVNILWDKQTKEKKLRILFLVCIISFLFFKLWALIPIIFLYYQREIYFAGLWFEWKGNDHENYEDVPNDFDDSNLNDLV